MRIEAHSKWVLLLAIVAAACSTRVENDRQIGSSSLSSAIEFQSVADAYADKTHPSSNYGAASTVVSDGNPGRVAYMRFEVSGLTSPVANAQLSFHAVDGTVQGPVAYTTSNAWAEADLTWANRPAPVDDTGAQLGAVAAGTWVSIDVTAQGQTNGTFSFLLSSSASAGPGSSSREPT